MNSDHRKFWHRLNTKPWDASLLPSMFQGDAKHYWGNYFNPTVIPIILPQRSDSPWGKIFFPGWPCILVVLPLVGVGTKAVWINYLVCHNIQPFGPFQYVKVLLKYQLSLIISGKRNIMNTIRISINIE